MQWILIWHWSNTSCKQTRGFCWVFCLGFFYVLIQIFIILLCTAKWWKLSVPDIWSFNGAASLEICHLTSPESNPRMNEWEHRYYTTQTFIKENIKISFQEKYYLENSITQRFVEGRYKQKRNTNDYNEFLQLLKRNQRFFSLCSIHVLLKVKVDTVNPYTQYLFDISQEHSLENWPIIYKKSLVQCVLWLYVIKILVNWCYQYCKINNSSNFNLSAKENGWQLLRTVLHLWLMSAYYVQ